MIKFNLYNVRDTETGNKVKIRYDLNFVINGEKCVTLLDKEYGYDLMEMFPDSINETDTMTDYHVKSKYHIPESHPLYAEAFKAATKAIKRQEERFIKKHWSNCGIVGMTV